MRRPAILLLAIAGLAPAEQLRVHLDRSQTQIQFTLGDVLHTVHGVFKLKSGDLWFDPSTGQAGGQIVVDASSGESGNDGRDTRMHKNILESAMYPDITFVPDRVEGKVNLDGDSAVSLHGQLTVHGAAHELTMNVKAHVDHQHLTADISFPVPYVKWGMKNPSTLFLRVKDTVEIAIQASGELVGVTP